jgi:uncharacterized protein
MKSAAYWIQQLELKAHPEGGFFKETYRSNETIPSIALPPRFTGSRAFSTSIYFLLRSQDRSMFHRIKSDELWHYYAGSSLTLYVINDDGQLLTYKLGPDVEHGDSLQLVIRAGCWFGAKVNEPESYVLSGCTVAPGFDFNDFEMADRNKLIDAFPEYREIISTLT